MIFLPACGPKVEDSAADDALLLPPGTAAVSGREAIGACIAGDMVKPRTAGLMFKFNEVTGVGVSGGMAWLSGSFSMIDAAGSAVDA
jgi:ketosteroid isomerase-like protein